MIQEQRLVDQFLQLVQVDSETKQEQEISKALINIFSDLGLQWEEDNSRQTTGHGANNLFFTLAATEGLEKADKIFFTSHMDTVRPGKGIKPQVDADGYIRSDGTTILGSDDKAGISAMLEAIRVLQEQKLAHGQIQFVITAGEESHLAGSRALDKKYIDAAYGFALDSNGKVGDICIAAPSQSSIHMAIIGKSAHAGVNPEAGISAIQVASKAISRMPLGRIDHETTANIGKFEGGGETNVVCDRADLYAEARSLVGEKLEAQIDKMKQALESACQEFGATAEFDAHVTYPAYKFEPDAPIVQLAKNALQRIGKTPRVFHSGGGSDANIFNGLGLPTLNLAVGYENIHTTKEQIPVSELVKTAEATVALIQEIAKSSN